MEWINGIFISSWKPWRIKNVIDELSKGVMLLRLMQALVCRDLPVIHPEPMLISERAENVELAIEVLKGEDIELPGILSQDIAEGKEDVILALCCFLKRHFQPFDHPPGWIDSNPGLLPPQDIPKSSSESTTMFGDNPMSSREPLHPVAEPTANIYTEAKSGKLKESDLTDDGLHFVPFIKEDITVLEWASKLVERYLEDYSVFKDGTLLCELVNKIALRKIPNEVLYNLSPLQKIQVALNHSKHELGIKIEVEASDVIVGRKQSTLRNYLQLLKRIHKNQMDAIRQELNRIKIKVSGRQKPHFNQYNFESEYQLYRFSDQTRVLTQDSSNFTDRNSKAINHFRKEADISYSPKFRTSPALKSRSKLTSSDLTANSVTGKVETPFGPKSEVVSALESRQTLTSSDVATTSLDSGLLKNQSMLFSSDRHRYIRDSNAISWDTSHLKGKDLLSPRTKQTDISQHKHQGTSAIKHKRSGCNRRSLYSGTEFRSLKGTQTVNQMFKTGVSCSIGSVQPILDLSRTVTAEEASDIETTRKRQIMHNSLDNLQTKLANLRTKNNETLASLKTIKATAATIDLHSSNPKDLPETDELRKAPMSLNSKLCKDKIPTKHFDSTRNKMQVFSNHEQKIREDSDTEIVSICNGSSHSKADNLHLKPTEFGQVQKQGIAKATLDSPFYHREPSRTLSGFDMNKMNEKPQDKYPLPIPLRTEQQQHQTHCQETVECANVTPRAATTAAVFYDRDTVTDFGPSTPRKKTFKEITQHVTDLVRMSSRSPRGGFD